MKKYFLLIVVLLVVTAMIAQSPAIRLLEKITLQQSIRPEEISRPNGMEVGRELQILCDAPRGNIVYVVSTRFGGNGTPPSVAITTSHQPDICK